MAFGLWGNYSSSHPWVPHPSSTSSSQLLSQHHTLLNQSKQIVGYIDNMIDAAVVSSSSSSSAFLDAVVLVEAIHLSLPDGYSRRLKKSCRDILASELNRPDASDVYKKKYAHKKCSGIMCYGCFD